MDAVNVHEAKTHLSRLLDRVESGEEIVISRRGKPIAKLSRFAPPARRPGGLEGRIKIRADFDDPLPPEVLRAFGIEG